MASRKTARNKVRSEKFVHFDFQAKFLIFPLNFSKLLISEGANTLSPHNTVFHHKIQHFFVYPRVYPVFRREITREK